jgi:hypothetical protein
MDSEAEVMQVVVAATRRVATTGRRAQQSRANAKGSVSATKSASVKVTAIETATNRPVKNFAKLLGRRRPVPVPAPNPARDRAFFARWR